MTILILLFTFLLSIGQSPISGIDDIKKINSLDVENLRADRSRLIKMEGHGSVLQYAPKVDSPFYTKPYSSSPLKEKEYPEPWRQIRPKKLQTPIPGNAIATTQNRAPDAEFPTRHKNTPKLLFGDIVERVQEQNKRDTMDTY